MKTKGIQWTAPSTALPKMAWRLMAWLREKDQIDVTLYSRAKLTGEGRFSSHAQEENGKEFNRRSHFKSLR